MKSGKYLDYTVYEDGTILKKDGSGKMKTYELPTGYLTVGLSSGSWRGSKSVHRIVGETLLPNPNNLSDIDHINGDRKDNRLCNLRWVSHGENIKHSYSSGRRSAKGSKNARSKLNEQSVHAICYCLQMGLKVAYVASIFDCSYAIISAIKNGRNWKEISSLYSLSKKEK